MTLPAVLPYYPLALLPEGEIGLDLFGNVLSGGQTASGVIASASLDGGGLWKATLADVPVRSREQVKAFRALARLCAGGVQPLVVPFCEVRYMPAPLDANGNRVVSLDDVLHAGDNPFVGGHGYHVNCVDAVAAADADLRATTISITVTEGGALEGGERFSVDDSEMRWRIYETVTVFQEADDSWTCTIMPPLRAALTAGTRLWFDKPRCTMKLATPGAMDLTLALRKRGKTTIGFIEAFPPFPELA